MSDTGPGIETLAKEISEYLHASKNPADTLEGISHWWLQHQGKSVPLADLQQALQLLVDSGVLEKMSLPDDKTVYRKSQGTSDERT